MVMMLKVMREVGIPKSSAHPSLSAVAERTLAGHDNIPLVRAPVASVPAVAVHRRLEEMCAGIRARCVDVVILGEIAHLDHRYLTTRVLVEN